MKQVNLVRLRKAISEASLSPEAIAKELGLHQRAIYYWLNGERKPQKKNLVDLAELLGLELGWFLGKSEPGEDPGDIPVLPEPPNTAPKVIISSLDRLQEYFQIEPNEPRNWTTNNRFLDDMARAQEPILAELREIKKLLMEQRVAPGAMRFDASTRLAVATDLPASMAARKDSEEVIERDRLREQRRAEREAKKAAEEARKREGEDPFRGI